MTLAARAAAAAGEIIRQGQTKIRQVVQKDVGDLVSKIDIDADSAICEILKQDDNGLAIVSEELNPDTYNEADDMWIVDPLDGTTAYLTGGDSKLSSVLIAKRVAGEVVLGVAYFPLVDEWFYAVRGQGAWKDGCRFELPSTTRTLGSCWVDMNQYGNAEFETSFFSALREGLRSKRGAQIVTSGLPSAGKALRLASAGKGISAIVHDNSALSVKQGPWDIAAIQLIVEEAGGVFINPDGDRTQLFDAQPIIVAPSMDLARQILSAGQVASLTA